MNTLVTGGAGFIGSHLADKLIEKGHKVVILDDLSTGKEENLNPQAKFYEMDIRDADEVASLFKKEKPKAVFHFAAQTSVLNSEKDPDEDTAINVLGSINILRSAFESKVKKFIFASTGGAMYGDTFIIPTPEIQLVEPLSVYGKNKLFFERMLEFHRHASELDYAALRFANVYGPRQMSSQEGGVIAIFIDTLLSGKAPSIYGDGNQTRDFLYVDDAAGATIAAFEAGYSLRMPHTFNVGNAREVSINELFTLISNKLSSELSSQYTRAKKGEVSRSALANQKIRDTLGFETQYDLDSGIEETIGWFRDRERSDLP